MPGNPVKSRAFGRTTRTTCICKDRKNTVERKLCKVAKIRPKTIWKVSLQIAKKNGMIKGGFLCPFLGNIGDYYYNTIEKTLWFKKQLADEPGGFGFWELIVNFSVNDKTCYITFDAGTNGGKIVEGENGEIEKDSITQSLSGGQYFYGSGKAFPTVYHPEGLKFLGWYTTETITPTSTKFTDLTIVTTDITLYAVWETK